MNPLLQQQKIEMRQRLRERAQTLTPAERTETSALLCQQLSGQPAWKNARSVLLFVPRLDEPDVWPLVAEGLAEGKIVTLPRSIGTDHYEACRIENALTALVAGRYGIPEPQAAEQTWPLNQLDFTLVPGIGFSFSGGRLGRGKGYYDRLLTQVSGLTCGVAFDWQITAEVPMEPHDVRLGCLVTPTRWHQIASAPQF